MTRHPSRRSRWGWRSVAVAVAAVVAVAGAPAAAFADPLAVQDPSTSADPTATSPDPSSAGATTDPATTTGAAPSAGVDSTAPGALTAPSPTHPDEPKIGVPLVTLSNDARGSIVLDGAPIGGTSEPLALHLAVIDVQTRNILFASDTPIGLGFDSLTAKVQTYRPRSVIVVASSSSGVLTSGRDVDEFNRFARAVGAPDLSPDAAERYSRSAASFSIVGTPGSEGSGYTKVAPLPDPGFGGAISGLLRWSPGPKRYSFVPTTPRVFDTSSGTTRSCPPPDTTSCTGLNTIAVDRAPTAADPSKTDSYPVSLPVGKVNGFQVLSLDSQTLAVRTAGGSPLNLAVDTGTPDGGSAALQAALEAAFRREARDVPPLVVVQSIGRPTANPGWSASAALIEAGGGSRQALLALDGAVGDGATASSDYTYVGSVLAGNAAVQASGKLGAQGPVTGVLAPAHDSAFLPQLATPDKGVPGGVNLDQVRIDYQPGQAYPSINRAAELALGRQVSFPGCGSPDAAPTDPARCGFRAAYVNQFDGVNWSDVRTRLAATTLGAGTGYTQRELDDTKGQLVAELTVMDRVKTFYVGLAERVRTASANGQPDDLQAAGQAVVDQVTAVVQPQRAGATVLFDAMKMLGSIISTVSLGTDFSKPFWGPFSTVFSLGANIYGASVDNSPGKPDTTLANAVRVQVNDLGVQARTSLQNAQYVPVLEGQIVAEDWGRMQAVSKLLADGTWELEPNDGGFTGEVARGLRTYFYKTVIATTYPLLITVDAANIATGPFGTNPRGVFKGEPLPKNIGCSKINKDRQNYTAYPWAQLPAAASITTTVGYTGTTPLRQVVFPTIAGPDIDNVALDANVKRNWIPQTVVDKSYSGAGALGEGDLIVPLEFYSPKYFPSTKTITSDLELTTNAARRLLPCGF